MMQAYNKEEYPIGLVQFTNGSLMLVGLSEYESIEEAQRQWGGKDRQLVAVCRKPRNRTGSHFHPLIKPATIYVDTGIRFPGVTVNDG